MIYAKIAASLALVVAALYVMNWFMTLGENKCKLAQATADNQIVIEKVKVKQYVYNKTEPAIDDELFSNGWMRTD